MAEKCTNTSSPLSCSMKPYPLASLNHFTFPLAIRDASYGVNRSCTAVLGKPTRLAGPYIGTVCQFVKQAEWEFAFQPPSLVHTSSRFDVCGLGSPRGSGKSRRTDDRRIFAAERGG